MAITLSVNCPHCGSEMSSYSFTLADPNNAASPRTARCPSCEKWSRLVDKHGVHAVALPPAPTALPPQRTPDPIIDLDVESLRPRASRWHRLIHR